MVNVSFDTLKKWDR